MKGVCQRIKETCREHWCKTDINIEELCEIADCTKPKAKELCKNKCKDGKLEKNAGNYFLVYNF